MENRAVLLCPIVDLNHHRYAKGQPMNITPLDGFKLIPDSMPILIIIGIAFIIMVFAVIQGIIHRDIMENVAIVTCIVFIMLVITQIVSTNVGAYAMKKHEITEYVNKQGFEIKDGSPAVYAGEDKTMKIIRDGQEFSCTSYAPEDPEGNIFFVCDSKLGFGRTSLEDLKLQLEKASDRATAEQEESTQTQDR